ncbi:xylulokinase [Bailinhaonella thermotolerans]|uniref:Xylulose kinase n=1 Tax=Bailinhaonella thermotolerans TaxID=1070861 RepID=A0A3A4AXV0_9ACTN|nr:xylulokinase [Bailinhaonella thermotolerans]RJL35502.1 xylulokinase [Bailinhaonella thermotolerans]
MLVAGVDSSTQSCKIVLCRAADGAVVAQGSAPHPDGTEADPAAWLAALERAGDGLLRRAGAVAVAAQQHGMVALGEDGEVVRPALLWNDVRSAAAAAELVGELGGPAEWARRAGSVPAASFTVTKLRWMAHHEPGTAARTRAVLLPHDWLTLRLGAAEPVTDRGDASGTGYFSPAEGAWLPALATAALGHEVRLPRVAGPYEVVGETPWGARLAPGTGDNMGAALGLGLGPGDVAVSIGTSGTAFAVRDEPSADDSGAVAGFCDATGRFLPLVCTLNAARVLTSTAALLGVDLEELSELALSAPPGAEGVTMLPYLDGERTPNRPGASGVLRGLTTRTSTRANVARAAVEAVLVSLAEAVDHLGVPPRRILLIGGGAASRAVRRIAPEVFGVPVSVPEPAEYVALGAARQAAWALAGTAEPPAWPEPAAAVYEADPRPAVREQYAALREATESWDAAP